MSARDRRAPPLSLGTTSVNTGTAVAFVRTIMTSVEKANATLGTPDSFADEPFYGVDAFVFVK